MLILRLHAALYYANALTVRDQVRALVDAADPLPAPSCSTSGPRTPSTSRRPRSLIALGRELRRRGIEAYLADVHTPALAFARSVGVLEVIDADHVFPTIDLAVQHIESAEINRGSQP